MSLDASSSTSSALLEHKRRLVEQLLQERAARDAASSEPHPFGKFVNPYVADLLAAFALDKRYVRGEGCRVFDERGNAFLDFTAAYGALPFGYNPPEIWRAIDRVREQGLPSFVQPSLLESAGALAQKLVEIAPAGLRYVAFASTGAEAVEVAIKLARAATGKRGIISTIDAFHGKTLGALSATGKLRYQQAFFAPLEGFSHVPYGDADALDSELACRAHETAAFIVEPIQGEGGIVVPPPGYLRAVREICDRHGVLLIIDEIQSGLGRAGALFACDDEGVVPDIMTLAKALSGGLVPVSATLYSERVYTREFAAQHTSTFANNALSCAVGLASLDLITRQGRALVEHVRECGAYLKSRLETLVTRYPGIVRRVRGRGFFLGLELTDRAADLGYQGILASLVDQGTLGFGVCSYLLNQEGIRLAPTLFATQVLRIEPPLTATRAMCDTLCAALDRALAHVAAGDMLGLLGHLVTSDPGSLARPAPRLTSVVEPMPGERRFGFVLHPVDAASFADLDPALQALSSDQVETLRKRVAKIRLDGMPNALVVGTCRVVSADGTHVYGELIAVAHTAAELLELPSDEAVAIVHEAVQVARDRGAQVVGLGAYSSIVTRNAEYLADAGVALTTGNAYTAASAVECVEQVLRERGAELAGSTAAVVGASGAIGRAVAFALMPSVGRLVLLGNPGNAAVNLSRLREMAHEMAQHVAAREQRGVQAPAGSFAAELGLALREHGGAERAIQAALDSGRLVLSVDREHFIQTADVIVTATSCPHGLLSARLLKHGAIVCDVSQPSNVSPDVLAARPDVELIDGGIIELPNGADLGINIGLEPGLTYACVAETMLMCLAGRFDDGSLGNKLSVELVEQMRALSDAHGFKVKRRALTRTSHPRVL
jgi:acetylornithine/succinyldiaminopimelate/putrescine aminotransferase/predicted amino acid dehydrogenase